MKRLYFPLFLLFFLPSCLKNLCLGEPVSETCEKFSAQPTNGGKAIRIDILKVEDHYYSIKIKGSYPDTIINVRDDTTIVLDQPFYDLKGEISAKCYVCWDYILRPFIMNPYTVKLHDTSYNALEIDTSGNIKVVKGILAKAPYLKFVNIGSDIYMIGNGVKISNGGSYEIAPDTGYYDTLMLSGEHALWIISGVQMFGKMRVARVYPESLSVEMGFRSDVKGLKWIK